MKRRLAGQKRPKTTRESYVTLPIELRNDIQNLPLTKTQISHCYKFVGILYRDSIADHWDATIPTPKPQNFLTKVFDDKYYKWLNFLIENDIVIRYGTPSNVIHKSYDYVVNPKYISKLTNYYESLLLVNQESQSINVLCKENYCEPLCTVTYKDIIKNETHVDYTYKKWFIDDMSTLEIQYDNLQDIALERINELSIDEFIVDNEVLPPSIEVYYDNGLVLYRNTNQVLSDLSNEELLIKDSGRYKIVNPVRFLSKKKATMKIYYSNSIERIKNNCLNAKRNLTNNRLDSNLTNMASILVDEICLQNHLIQIDLSNSQFVLLTNLIKNDLKSDDYKLFKELSVSGELYGFIAEKLSLKNKENGKSLMFEVMFSSRRNNSVFKQKIKELFPSVVDWIDNYKKVHGDNQFSIMLQKYESDLFIDKILKRIKKQKLFCITKHDSLIVKKEDYETIIAITENEFESIGLEYTLKITNLLGTGETSKIYSKNNSTESTGIEIVNEIAEEITVDVTKLTLTEIQDIGYTFSEFRNTHGNSFKIPKVFVRYWDKIKARKGTIRNLYNTYNQNEFELELKKSIENMISTEMILNSFANNLT